jgi:hypothetical protein
MVTTRPYGLWAICLLVPLLTLIVYSQASRNQAGGDLALPLDDTYIHFQYARQLAEGDPYVYNPGEPATSGATSFLYPFVLGAGYIVGFTGLSLGWWAVMIGAVLLGLSMRWVAQIVQALGGPRILGTLTALAFGLNGALAWHAMSGMETLLITNLTLATLHNFIVQKPYAFMITAGLLALTRPEGSIMAVIASLLYIARRPTPRWPVIVPLFAIAIQPAVNFIITGNLSASGNQAKSILGMVPFAWDVVIERITENAARIAAELANAPPYAPLIIPPLALLGGISLSHRHKWTLALLIFWFITVAGAIATLDTAFWHFKRYQMPLIALLFPLAGCGVWWLWRQIRQSEGIQYRRWPRYALLAGLLLLAIETVSHATHFRRLYSVNVANVAAQPLPMARWLNLNTPPDAVIAVHDVGMIRYIGERQTLDMVGLTTPDAADYWRHGPGAVGEFLLRTPPDYVAAYTTARGLNYLVETPLYGDLLVGFTADYAPADNVAVGAPFQGVYAVDHEMLQANLQDQPVQPSIHLNLDEWIASVNVADLASEATVNYTWTTDTIQDGFATEFYTFSPIACQAEACTITDGGRRIHGTEQITFTLPADAQARDLILVSRVHPAHATNLLISANGMPLDSRVIFEQPGQWLEIATAIPATFDEQLTLTLQPEDGVYMPYYHWLYTAQPPARQDIEPIATFQDGAIQLLVAETDVIDSQLRLQLQWQTDGTASGDYRFFAHVYDALDQPPVAQYDAYPVNGTLPPGNWLPGVISDEFMVDLRGQPVGVYTLAIGFYAPGTFDRLAPETNTRATDTNRLIVDEIEIE